MDTACIHKFPQLVTLNSRLYSSKQVLIRNVFELFAGNGIILEKILKA
jgi:hypothetical protein